MAEPSQDVLTATIARLTHDLVTKTSVVSLVWNDEKHRLNLEIPFGTPLDALPVEAEKALRRHASDMAVMRFGTEV